MVKICFFVFRYTENVTRKGIARKIHHREDHLTRVFQTETGQKISEYLKSQ